MATMSASGEGQLPVLESVVDQPEYSDDPQLAVSVDAIATAKAWPALPGVAELAAVQWGTTMQQAFQGELTSTESLASMADVLRAE